MRLSAACRSLAVVSAFLCATAFAQTRFCIGGELDQLTAAQKNTCNARMQAVKAAASALHAPENWHFVIVCGESGWKSYADYAMNTEVALLNASADTNLEQHETFLRADRLDLDHLRSLQRVVAHEVAGILLRSKDEMAINHQMEQWMGTAPERDGL